MKTVVTETEVNRVATDAVNLAMQKLPFDGQDENDRTLANHFLLDAIYKVVNPRLEKLEKGLKEEFRRGDGEPAVIVSKNYRRQINSGTPRESFDLEQFISNVCNTYPEVMAHRLRELAATSKKLSAAPVSVEIEYIGDLQRHEQ